MGLDNDLRLFQANVSPAMEAALFQTLDLQPRAGILSRIPIGYYPGKTAWVIPERTADMKLCGLCLRSHFTGKKWMHPGSKRGFLFAPRNTTSTGIPKFHSRVSIKTPCPICQHSDWCLIKRASDGTVISAICQRIQSKSSKQAGAAGHLHILDPRGKLGTSHQQIDESPLVLIVEGFSDWLVATLMGFVAIGKPNNTARVGSLTPHLVNKDVVVIGDHDQPGIEGMENSYQTLRKQCKSIKKLLPPEGFKDLRQWYVNGGLTAEILKEDIEKRGESTTSSDILDNGSPLVVARSWMDEIQSYQNIITIRNYKGMWVVYDRGVYAEYDMNAFRGSIYGFLMGRSYLKETGRDKVAIPFKPDRTQISNAIDALNTWCVVTQDPPCWLDGVETRECSDLVIFNNGIINVEDYFESGVARLLEPTPEYFTMTSIPHAFDVEASCPNILATFRDIMSNDEQKFQLLQEWFGYMLVAVQRFEKLMLFVGRPRSGKGTVLEVLTAMLGTKQVAITSFTKLSKEFGRHCLIGTLAAILPDAAVPRNMDATAALETIKTITGGDPVNIGRKYLSDLSNIRLGCRFTIAVNMLPELPDHSRALEPRLNIISFDESYIGREDRNLKTKLTEDEKEIQGLLVWSLQGLKRLYARQEFTSPESSKPILSEFRSLATPAAEFLEECCIIEDSAKVARQQLYDCWKAWAELAGLRAGPRSQLQRRIMSLHMQIITKKEVINNRTFVTYHGIRLKNSAIDEYLKGN